jgi:hypothetical protein
MTRKKPRPAPQKLIEPRQVSPELQERVDRFAKSLARLILVRINPDAARQMAEEPLR